MDGALDWIKEGQQSDSVPEAEVSMHAWLQIRSALPSSDALSHPLEVLYSPRKAHLPVGRVEIRVQGVLENANLHPKGERVGYVRLNDFVTLR